MELIQFKRLHHFQICIPKDREEEARRFYAQILGLEEIAKPDELLANGGLWFKIAGIELHIGTEDGTQISKRHPAFEIENLNKARQYLTKHFIKTQDEIEIPGQSRFSFFDPFGNRIELLKISTEGFSQKNMNGPGSA